MITGDTPPAAPSLGDFLTTEDQQKDLEREIGKLKLVYPNLDESKKPMFFGKQQRNSGWLVVKGEGDGTEIRVFNKDGSINQTFARTNSKWLGPTAKTLIAERDRALREDRVELRNAERDESKLLSQHQQATNEATNLNNRLERTRARIAALEEGPDSIEEHRADIDRQKTVESSLKTDLENLTKEAAALENNEKHNRQMLPSLKHRLPLKQKKETSFKQG